VPYEMAIFGPEEQSHGSYPDIRRAALVFNGLPIWWLAEQWVVPPRRGHAGDARMTYGIYSPQSQALNTTIREQYPLAAEIDPFGWKVFEYDEVKRLALELLDIVDTFDFPQSDLLAYAARMIQRMSSRPIRVMFVGL